MFHGTRKLTVGAGLLVMLVGCAGSSPTTPGPVVSASPTPAPVASDLVAVLNADIQDEYRAEAIYQGVLLDLGAGTMPFANIIRAEQQHARSVAALFTARGLAVPASVWSPSNVPRFSTLREACAAGAVAERENIALYDSQLGLSLRDDVRRVLQNNRDASLYNHLPAFQRCQ
jgi:hypothetical protein